MEELDEFLTLELGDGTLHSSGVFTMNIAEAVAKLSKFTLENDTQALLKLIQGCVGWKAQELWIFYAERQIDLYFTTPVNFSAVAPELLCNFEATLLGGDSGEHDLLVGLTHFLAQKPYYVGMAAWEKRLAGEWHDIFGTREGVKIRRPPNAFKGGIGIHILMSKSAGREKPWTGPTDPRVRAGVMPPVSIQAQDFADRCFFAPLPIHVNGDIPGLYPDSFFLLTSEQLLEFHRIPETSTHGFLGPRPKLQATSELTGLLGWPEASQSSHSAPKNSVTLRALGLPQQNLRGRAFRPTSSNLHEGVVLMSHSFSVPYGDGSIYIPVETKWGDGTDGEVLIFPVKRGVFLNPFAIRVPGPPCTVILPADDTPTDLSQFSVLLGPASNELCVRACRLLREGLEICSQNSTRIPSGKDPNLIRGATVSLVTGAVMFLATGLPVSIPIGMASGAVFEAIAKAFDNSRNGRARAASKSHRYRKMIEALEQWETQRAASS